MTKLYFLVLSVFFASGVFAQKASIKGRVVDSISKLPVEHATVAIVNAKDTSLVSYTISQKDGSFKLTGLPVDRPTRLIVSSMTYNTYRQSILFKPGEAMDMGDIKVTAKSLNEVVVRAERSPIVMKKDTIEFNTEAFKTRPNAVVEDLLRLLPGIQVDYDGTITINGKSVSKLLVDGKRFFGDDPKVASKNLDADMLDKIQVYDDRENDPDHKLSEAEVNKIINIKLKKKIKKSTLGKIYAGGGTRDRYEAGGILSNFRDTLQVSLIGLANNLNQTGFSYNELYTMGGFNRSGGNQAWDGTFGGRSWGGMESVASGGININNNYGEKLKLNLGYFYTQTIRNVNSKNRNEQTLPTTLLTSNSVNNNKRTENKHAINALIEWKPDTLKNIRYEPHASFVPTLNLSDYTSTSFNTQTPRLNESFGNSTSASFNNSFSHYFMFYRKLGHRGKSITISNNLSLNTNGSDDYGINNTRSFVSTAPSQNLKRYSDNDSKNNNVGVSLSYNHPINKKLTAELNTNTRYLDILSRSLAYDTSAAGVYNVYLDTLSKNLTRNWFIQNIKPQLNYKISDNTTIRFGADYEYQHLVDRFNQPAFADRKANYQRIFPWMSMSGQHFSFSYSETLDQPAIDQLQPGTRKYSEYYQQTGNPDLEPSHTRNFYGNYYYYNYDKQRNINLYANFTYADNTVVYATTIDDNSRRTSTYVNRNGSINTYFGGNISKQFKKSQKWQVGLNNNFNGGYRRNAFFLNADEGIQSNYNLGSTQNINFNYNSVVTFNTNYRINAQLTKYKDVDFATVATLTHTAGTDVTVRWPARMIFDAKYNINYNPQVSQGFPKSSHIVNFAVTLLMLKKDLGQLKLSVYDLLDQNISVYRYAGNNSVTLNETQILKRYFLLNYQYKLTSYK